MSGAKKTTIKEIVETANVIKFKKGYRYLIAIDHTKVPLTDISRLEEYLDQYGIQSLAITGEGKPDSWIKIYEAETKI